MGIFGEIINQLKDEVKSSLNEIIDQDDIRSLKEEFAKNLSDCKQAKQNADKAKEEYKKKKEEYKKEEAARKQIEKSEKLQRKIDANLAQLQAYAQSNPSYSYSSITPSTTACEDSERRARERKEEVERKARERQAEADRKEREKERIEKEKNIIKGHIESIERDIRGYQLRIEDLQRYIKNPNTSANAKKSARESIERFRQSQNFAKERFRAEKERLRAVK